MKVQKSALPYIILLLGLFIGVPTADYFLSQEKGEDSIVISIDDKIEDSNFLAKNP